MTGVSVDSVEMMSHATCLQKKSQIRERVGP